MEHPEKVLNDFPGIRRAVGELEPGPPVEFVEGSSLEPRGAQTPEILARLGVEPQQGPDDIDGGMGEGAPADLPQHVHQLLRGLSQRKLIEGRHGRRVLQSLFPRDGTPLKALALHEEGGDNVTQLGNPPLFGPGEGVGDP